MISRAAAANEGEPISILVVDDRPENVLALRAVLSLLGHRVVAVASGQEALRAVLASDFAVVLLDVVMPGMDGFETARLIRERDRSRALPIIFLTANGADLGAIYRAYEVGAVDYLTKPFDPTVVRAKVAAFVELFRETRQIEHQAALLRDAERARCEQALRASEEMFAATIEAAASGIAHASLDGRFLRVNPRLCEIAGCDDQTLLSRRLQDFALPEERSVAERLVQGVASGELQRHRASVRWQRAGSNQFLWVTLAASLLRDGAGLPDRLVLVVEDVTEARRAEDHDRFLAMASELLLGSLDLEETLAGVLKLAASTLADGGALWLREESGALRLLEGNESCELQALRPQVDEVLRTRAGAKTGSALLLPLICRGSCLGVLGLCRTSAREFDEVEARTATGLAERAALAIDNARLYSEAQAAVRLRDDFLSIASHELRTPLTSLSLQLSSLLRWDRERLEALTAEGTRKLVQRAERQVKRLTSLVESLLDVARISRGIIELKRERFDLAEMAREVTSRFVEEAAVAGSEVRLQASAAVPGEWDRLRIEQVLTNLLSNALKYGAGKPIEVTVEAAADRARLSVRDHGIGIVPERQTAIFERFERAVSSREYGGLGLGLYIARQIVSAHGGNVSVQSQPQQGSLFTVELPVKQ